jgi:hypothetical protein
MTLLTICQDTAGEAGVAVPTTIISNSETTAIRLLALAKREITTLAHNMPWQALVAEHTFVTVGTEAQTSATPIPTDFDYFIRGTVWNRTLLQQLAGPLTPAEWQRLKAIDTSTGNAVQRFRRRGDLFIVHPVPSAGDTIAYEYAIDTPVESSGGTAQQNWIADADVAKIPEELVTMGVKWRFRKAMGLDYTDDLREYIIEVEKALLRDNDQPDVNVASFEAIVQQSTTGFDWRVG